MTENRIRLTIQDGNWMATFEGPQAAETIRLFGTPTLPTPFRAARPITDVVARIQRLNPGMIVTVNS